MQVIGDENMQNVVKKAGSGKQKASPKKSKTIEQT
jgi:hypothetical protein